MARTPKLRVNFDSDVQYLLRMKHAIEEDSKWSKEFKEDSVVKIMDLVHHLMKGDVKKTEQANGDAA
jgi:hypothetical protein